MQCSKVFGYTLFSEYLIVNAPMPNHRESGRRARGVSDLRDRKYYSIFATIQNLEGPLMMFSQSQTCYFKHSYLSLQANQTGESYKRCTLRHVGCKLTRFEHFLRDIQQAVFRYQSTPPKDTTPKEFDWLTEHLIQQFYNNVLTFNEFLQILLKIANFTSMNILTAQRVCWEVYHREYHSVFQKLALVNEHSVGFIEKLFAIFTQLDRHVSCEISPFLMKQFIIWWTKESETNPDKHFQLIENWYESSDGQFATIDFIEFVDLLYKLFFKHFPITTRHFLLKDAYDSLVGKVLKKGYLAKCGPNNSKYQVRWMILYPDRLEYYKRRSEEDMAMKGAIQLGDKAMVKNVYDDDKKGFYKFTVSYTSTARQFSIRADDIRIRMSWVTAIDQAIDVLRGNKGLQVFEKPLDLTNADHDLLRSSSTTSSSSGYSSTSFAVKSVPLPAPYNGAFSDDPLIASANSIKADHVPLTSQDCHENQTRTLRIQQVDQEFSEDLINSLYMSGCPPQNTASNNDFRSQQFSSSSSSEDEFPLPPLPDRNNLNKKHSSQDCDNPPVPAPRNLHKQYSGEDLTSNRISMNTHSSFETYNTLRVDPANPLPKLAPRFSHSTDLPKRPSRNIPLVPKRVESLTRGRRSF